jgi:dCTP deaminase
MSTLSDRDILSAFLAGKIIIHNFDTKRLQPASYDVLLGGGFFTYDFERIAKDHGAMSMDIDCNKYMKYTEVESGRNFRIPPLGFALGVVQDFLGTDSSMYCDILGKSSLARKGLIIHATAGFVDPNNKLNITLEFFNCLPIPWDITVGKKIGQIRFDNLTSPCVFPYGHEKHGSKYYLSTNVQPSQYHKNYTDESIFQPGELTLEFCKQYALEHEFLEFQNRQIITLP